MVIPAPKYKINKRDVVLHERLQEAYDEGRLIVHTDFLRLNRTDSPVFSPWLNTLPLLTLLTLALLVLLFGGLLSGTVALVLAVAIYAVVIRPWTAQTVHRTAVALMMRDAGSWVRLWNHGGIVLQLAADRRVGCVAPEGDWRAFASRYFTKPAGAESSGLSMA